MEFTSHPETKSVPATLTRHVFFPLFPKACQLLLLFTYMEEGLSSEKEGSGSSWLLFWAGRSIG